MAILQVKHGRNDLTWFSCSCILVLLSGIGGCGSSPSDQGSPPPSNALYVAPNGSDTNPGTIGQPFQTIQKCASTVSSGGACDILAGTYHETVTPPSNITITSYNGEAVTIDGTDAVTGWAPFQGSVYKASVSLSSGDTNQVFVGTQMMTEARWPNGDDLFHVNWATAQAGTTTTLIVDPNLPNVNWAGATIHLYSGSDPWTHLTGTVTASAPGQVAIAMDTTSTCPYQCPQPGGYYYLFGILGALDTQNEWAYDSSAGVLYFWAPGGVNPSTLDVRAKQRQLGFDLSGKSNVTIRNINLFACTINTDANSTNDVLDGINAQYLSHFTTLPGNSPLGVHLQDSGIILNGSGNSLVNSTLAYSAGNGVVVTGSNNTVKNNLIHHVDYIGDYTSGVLLGDGTVQNATIQGNTIYASGRNTIGGVIWTGNGILNSSIIYNNLFGAMMFSRDSGEFYVCCGSGAGTHIDHNWIHDTQSLFPGPADNYPVSGVDIDNDSSGFEVDQNVLWNNQYNNINVFGNGQPGPNNNNIHNNSIPDINGSGNIDLYGIPNCGTTQTVDNLVLVPVSNGPGCTASDNSATAPGATDMNSTVQVGCNFAGCSTNGPPVVSGGAVAASIAVQPLSVTVSAGQTATFWVTAAGSPTLKYQWQKNGTNISGANTASYTTPATTATDNGAVFTVQVSNAVGGVTSNPATMTVN